MLGRLPGARRIGAVTLVLAATVIGCARAPEHPDVLLVTIDTLRADRLGSYGYAEASTPTLDRLAREGVRYAQCQSPIPVTLPSHASILTGLYPPEHGVRNNASYRLPEHIPTLPEELKAAGYTTGAFVAALPLAARFGLDRGFDRYDASLPDARSSLFDFRERPASEVVRSLLSWVEEKSSDEPIFAWAHFFEPHAPYEAPQPAGADAYDAEVAVADRALGLLIERLTSLRGRAPLIVVTSDHGEGLGEHGENTHAIFLYQTTLHVPLLFHAPGRWPTGRTVDEPVSLVDLAPTLLRELGIEPRRMRPSGLALEVGFAPQPRALYSESIYAMEAYRWAPLAALREGSHKVIRSRISWAFDLQSDPAENEDLLSGGAVWAQQQLGRLDGEIERFGAFDVAAGRQPTPEELQALAALGYVGGRGGTNAEGDFVVAMRALPDVTERHEEFAQTRRAEQLIGEEKYAAAVAELQGVLVANPDNVWAHMLLGQALGSDDRNLEAVASYERAVALRPDWLDAHRSLARLHSRLGEGDEALGSYVEALRIDPSDVELRLEAASLLQRASRLEQAETLLLAGLEHGGDDEQQASIEAALARVYFQQDRLDEGRSHLERARAIADEPSLRLLAANYARQASRWPEVLDTLGNEEEWEHSAAALELRGEALQRLGRVDEAVADYERAIALDEGMHLAHNNLAWALAATLERPQEALSHAERAVALLPDEMEYHDTYLEILLRLGREGEAREHLKALLAEHPGDPTLRERANSLKMR